MLNSLYHLFPSGKPHVREPSVWKWHITCVSFSSFLKGLYMFQFWCVLLIIFLQINVLIRMKKSVQSTVETSSRSISWRDEIKCDLKLNIYKLAYRFPHFPNVKWDKWERKIRGQELALFGKPVYPSHYGRYFGHSSKFSPIPFYCWGIWSVEKWK